jgi:hypothetical protein
MKDKLDSEIPRLGFDNVALKDPLITESLLGMCNSWRKKIQGRKGISYFNIEDLKHISQTTERK